jgi:hypothetical protein
MKLGLDNRQGEGFFFTPSEAHFSSYPVGIGIKQPQLEAGDSPPSTTEIIYIYIYIYLLFDCKWVLARWQ